jgi:uncharacterized protein
MTTRGSPFHGGEIEVQRRAGVREEAASVGGIISATIPPQFLPVLPVFRMAVAASIDGHGRAWASLLTGAPGFIQAVEETILRLDARPHAGDPLGANLATHPAMGLLAIEPASRRRLRFNGRGFLTSAVGLVLAVEQAYGNCRKYIQARRPVDTPPAPDGHPARRSSAAEAPSSGDSMPSGPTSRLSAPLRARIAAADTFFIASFAPDGGADASHRGGRPGFVRIESDRRLSFPDYPGNNMFNTLGNLTTNPTAGLLFVDFETGDLAQITGRATLDWSRDAVAAHPGARSVVVGIDIDEVLESPGASTLRWSPAEAWPGNP